VSPDPIDAWHGILDDEQLALDSAGWLERAQQDRELGFGDRPLCTVLRPRFLSTAQYDGIRHALSPILSAFQTIGEGALGDAAFRKHFHLQEWEETLLARMPRLPWIAPLSRLDAFLDPVDGNPWLTECNGETPAGNAYGDVLSDLFLAVPAMRHFARDWIVRPLPTRPHLLGTLLECWHQHSGVRTSPNLAIVDFGDVPTLSEFRWSLAYFDAMGVSCWFTTPDALRYEKGKLLDEDGTQIDLVYKRVLLHELVAHGGVDHPLLRAVADGAVCMVNSIHGKPLHKKASLAVLSDERHMERFSSEQRVAIDRHVPWTRVLEERHTLIDGQRIDLLPWAAENQGELVLKPNDDYGGAGIVLGWEVDDSTWQAALNAALDNPCIIQRRVALPRESFPAVVDGSLVYDDRIVDTAPFCWQGAFVDGALSRISTSTLVNVTAGGGSTVPTLIVEPR
jgi:hypothetical protein